MWILGFEYTDLALKQWSPLKWEGRKRGQVEALIMYEIFYFFKKEPELNLAKCQELLRLGIRWKDIYFIIL